MDSSRPQDTASTTVEMHQARRWAAWRALPRLVVSRRWRWATLGVLVIAAGMLRLGIWQLDRLGERRVHNALLSSRLAAPPLELTDASLEAQPEEYRRVIVRGTFDASNEIVLRSRAYQGSPGVDIVTPLRIAGSERHILVNRGWVPLLGYDAAALQEFVVRDEVLIEGVVRKPSAVTSSFGPRDNPPAEGQLRAWFRVDPARIARQLPYPVLPYYVEQLTAEAAQGLPRPHPNIELSEGSHLNYAIQWFSFATIGLCGYAAFVVHSEQEEARRRLPQRAPPRAD